MNNQQTIANIEDSRRDPDHYHYRNGVECEEVQAVREAADWIRNVSMMCDVLNRRADTTRMIFDSEYVPDDPKLRESFQDIQEQAEHFVSDALRILVHIDPKYTLQLAHMFFQRGARRFEWYEAAEAAAEGPAGGA